MPVHKETCQTKVQKEISLEFVVTQSAFRHCLLLRRDQQTAKQSPNLNNREQPIT